MRYEFQVFVASAHPGQYAKDEYVMQANRDVDPSKLEAYVAHAKQCHEASVDRAVLNGTFPAEKADRCKATFSPAQARRLYVLSVFTDLITEAVSKWPAGETEAEAADRKREMAMLGGAS